MGRPGVPRPVAKLGWSKSPLRDDFRVQNTTLPAQKAAGRFPGSKYNSFTLRAYPPTCLYVPAELAPPPNFRDALSSLLQGAENGRDERRVRAVRRAARALRARTGGRALRARSLGGWARGALWGYSEAIPNGKLFRSHFEWKVIPEPVRLERPFRMDGPSE